MVTFLAKKEVKLSKRMCWGMSCVTMYLFCFAPSIANPEHFNLESIELNVSVVVRQDWSISPWNLVLLVGPLQKRIEIFLCGDLANLFFLLLKRVQRDLLILTNLSTLDVKLIHWQEPFNSSRLYPDPITRLSNHACPSGITPCH